MTAALGPMPSPAYRAALVSFVVVLAVLLTLHYDAAARAVHLWLDSPTYSFAFLIIPLSIYLVVHRLGLGPAPRLAPVPALMLLQVPIAGLWYLAVAVEVIEVQQFCLLAAIYVAIASIFGFAVVRSFAVALILLVFLVPSGQFAIALLQDSSAVLSVLFLRLIDVPVFQDGWVIQLPTSSYFVAPGCAGLNFVLVALVLGLVVGELFYNGIGKRIAVLAGLLAMALIANPIRIFAIIAIDWATDQTTDIVSDHLTYGWAFFAGVLAICLPIALQFREDLPAQLHALPPTPSAAPRLAGRIAATAILGIVLAGAIPLTLFSVGIARARAPEALPALPAALDGAPVALVAPWHRIAPASLATSASVALPAGALRLDVWLREVGVPHLRLLDQFPPRPPGEEAPASPRGTAAVGQGEAGFYLTAYDGDRRLWAACYLVEGRCQPNGGAYRRALLKSLPANPQARAGLVVASLPIDSAGGSLADLQGEIVRAVAAAVAALDAPKR